MPFNPYNGPENVSMHVVGMATLSANACKSPQGSLAMYHGVSVHGINMGGKISDSL